MNTGPPTSDPDHTWSDRNNQEEEEEEEGGRGGGAPEGEGEEDEHAHKTDFRIENDLHIRLHNADEKEGEGEDAGGERMQGKKNTHGWNRQIHYNPKSFLI